jgi:hypothetical protein
MMSVEAKLQFIMMLQSVFGRENKVREVWFKEKLQCRGHQLRYSLQDKEARVS